MRALIFGLSCFFFSAAALVTAMAFLLPVRVNRPAAASEVLVAESSSFSFEDEVIERLEDEQAAGRARMTELHQTIAELQDRLSKDENAEILENLEKEQAADRARVEKLQGTITDLKTELKRYRDQERSSLSIPSAVDEPLPAADLKEGVPPAGRQSVPTEDARTAVAREPSTGRGRIVAILGGGLFLPGQEVLSPQLEESLKRVLPEIVANPEHRISVEGHTDNIPIRSKEDGKLSDNLSLSRERAQAVANVMEKMGVAADRMVVAGYGDTRPMAPNSTPAGRAENRRVEIRLVPPGENGES